MTAYTDTLTSANPDPVLKLIARTPTGRGLLEQFLPILKRGEVALAPYPDAIVAKLRAVIPVGHPIGACFVDEGTHGKIYLDFTSPIGILAPFLVHEIAHALGAHVLGQTSMDEEVAFQTQFRFTDELRARDPSYEAFLRTHYPKAKTLHALLEFEGIEELYKKSA